MRFSFFAMMGLSMLLWSGCGGSSSAPASAATPQFGIASGNWSIILLSQPGLNPGGGRAGGSLVQSGNTITGTLHIVDSLCFDLQDDLSLSGTAAKQNISFTSAPLRGQTIVFTSDDPPLVFSAASTVITGSYAISGGACAGEKGSFVAGLIPALTGTWKGSVTGLFTADVAGTLTQTGPDSHGFFHLSGSFTFDGLSCFSSGTIASSQMYGPITNAVLDTNDSGQTLLDTTFGSAPPQHLSAVFSIQSGACRPAVGIATLIKQ